MTQKTSSFYLPSPDDLYKDLCREMQSDLYDLSWHKNQVEGLDYANTSDESNTVIHSQAIVFGSTEAVKGTTAGYRELQSDLYDLHWHKHQIESLDSSTYSGTLRSYTPPYSADPRIIRVECGVENHGFNFEAWYLSMINTSGGEKFFRSSQNPNSYYIVFESVEDAQMVHEYLKSIVADLPMKVSFCNLETSQFSSSICSHNERDGVYDHYTPESQSRSANSFCQEIPLSCREESQANSLVCPTGLWGRGNDTGDMNICGDSLDEQGRLSLDSLSDASHMREMVVAEPHNCRHSPAQVDDTETTPQCQHGKIVHVVMTQNTCLDKVIELMSIYGKINKIIMFTKDTSIQALIEFKEVRSAAKSVRQCHLNGMSVQFSRLSELKIQQNNNRAWDFTSAPTRVMSARSSSPISLISIGFNEILSMKRLPKEMRDWLKSITDHQGVDETREPIGPYGNVIIVYNLSCSSVNEIFNIFSIYGVCTRVKFLRQKESCALVQYRDPVYASFAKYFLSHTNLWTSPGLQISYSKIDNVKLGPSSPPLQQRHHCRYDEISTETPEPPMDVTSRAYIQSDQRFCEVLKYGNCVSFPSETIFVASIAEITTKARLLELFSSVGKIVAYDLRMPYTGGPKKPHMLVQYTDVNTALRAIALLHNLVIDGSQIKIAFSKVRLMR